MHAIAFYWFRVVIIYPFFFVSVVFGGDGDSSVRCCGGVGIFGSDIKTLQQRGDKRLILCVLLLSVLKLMAAVLKTLWPGF